MSMFLRQTYWAFDDFVVNETKAAFQIVGMARFLHACQFPSYQLSFAK